MRRNDSRDQRGEARLHAANVEERRIALRRRRRRAARSGQVVAALIMLVSAWAVLAATAGIVLGH